MTAAVASPPTLRSPSQRALDLMRLDINVDDRVWLVTFNGAGWDRLAAGTVLEIDFDGQVWWTEDGSGSVHSSASTSLKVVTRAKGARR